MKTPGHTIVLISQGQPLGDTLITLECTCGKVLTRGLFMVNDAVNQQRIRDEGHAAAKEHLAQTLVAAQS